MQRVLSFNGREVSGVFDLCEMGEIQPLWEECAIHPSVDPAIKIWEFQENSLSPCILIVKSRGRLQGMAIGYIKETRLDIKLRYWTVAKPKARLIAILDRGVIAHEDGVHEAIVRALFELLSGGIADYCHLACIDRDSPLRAVIMSDLIPRQLKDTSGALEPRWVLELPNTYNEFLQSRSTKTRKNILWEERRLRRREGSLEIQIQRGCPGHVTDLYEDVQAVFRSTYQYKLKLSPLCSPQAEMMWKRLSDLRRLVAAVTYIEGAPVSFAYAHVFKSVAKLETPGFLPKYGPLEVGKFSILRLIEALCGTGVRELDYGLGYSQYKETFGTRSSLEGHIRLFAPTRRAKRLRALISTVKRIESALDRSVEALGVKRRLRRYLKRGKS
jgi:hypothetical protein